MSEKGLLRLQELRTKYPEQEIEIPPRRAGCARQVGSPIPCEELESFSDDQWITAMHQYDYGWDGLHSGTDPKMKGTAVELSRVLEPQARLDRHRFAALTSRMNDSIRSEYFEAILDGICGAGNLHNEEREEDNKSIKQLDSEVVFKVVRRLHNLPNRPCGRSICRAFSRFSDRSIPESDLNILVYYAIEDADPKSDDWLHQYSEDNLIPSDNAFSYGYNSVRGAAANAIKNLLFGDYSHLKVFLPVLRKMVCDPSIAVRTCAIEALLPMLNHDRDEAVRLLKATCDGAELVLGSNQFENFVNHASSTHYSELRNLLREALSSKYIPSIQTSARQICLAALSNPEADSDAELVRNADASETMRSAAAEIYSYNIGDAAVGTICQQHLIRLFQDESEKVRSIAAGCFLHLKDSDFNEYSDFIQAYIESPSFPSKHDGLLRSLENSTWQLPDITIRLAERFISTFGKIAGDTSTAAAGDAPTVAKLVVRLYAHTNNDELRSKCLDLIDEMERLAFFGIDSQLAEHDR